MIYPFFPVEHFSCTDYRCVALHDDTDFSVTFFEKMRLQQVFTGSNHKAEQGNDCTQPNLLVF
jgi:hypothetical protein